MSKKHARGSRPRGVNLVLEGARQSGLTASNPFVRIGAAREVSAWSTEAERWGASRSNGQTGSTDDGTPIGAESRR